MAGVPEFRHGCSFCGWATRSLTPVMLVPSCSRCGCALDARMVTGPAPAAPALSFPAAAVRALRALALAAGALSLYAAANVGFRSGGVAGGMIALGVAGFLALPFVPERVGGRG